MRTTSLRAALAANCVFSTLTGASMLAYPTDVGIWIGLNEAAVLRIVGGLLVSFAAALLYAAWLSSRPQPIALAASFADLAWVVATAVLGIVAPNMLSDFGWAVATIVALIVLGCAVWQAMGIDLSYRDPSRRGWVRLCLETQMDAPQSAVWSIVSDLEAIADHSPMLASSRITHVEAETGLQTRQCHDTRGKSWNEIIKLDRESMRLDARFETERPGFPFPFAEMLGGWEVDRTESGSKVKVWWSILPRSRPFAFFFFPIMEVLIRSTFQTTLLSIRNAAVSKSPIGHAERQAKHLQMAVC